MIHLIEEHLSEIKEICLQFNVSRLEVFGSVLSGDFDQISSDIDLLMEFKPLKPIQYADTYFGLLEATMRDIRNYAVTMDGSLFQAE
jgi:uncharacterized protein